MTVPHRSRAVLPARDAIGPDTPLRLDVAAALAFPDGSMTAAGLRRESARDRLVIARIAGKDYTTLADIGRMIEQCRRAAKAPDFGCASPGETGRGELPIPQPGSSRTDLTSAALAAAQTIVQQRRETLRHTSPKSMSPKRRPKANVIRVKFRSPRS